MKTGLVILFSALILYCSCHKTDAAINTGGGYWYIFGQQHSVTYTTRKDTAGMVLLTAGDTLPTVGKPFVSTISILLGSLPADSAKFQIIAPPYPVYYESFPGINLPLSANQLFVFGTAFDYTNYGSFDPDSCREYLYLASERSWTNPITPVGPATVSVVGGKINVVLPTDVIEAFNHCGDDSVILYGNIQEK